MDNEVKPTGFYTTRFVEAEDHIQAEIIGLEALRADSFFADEAMKSRSLEARVEFEEIEELKGKPPKIGIWPFRRHEGDGFVFY